MSCFVLFRVFRGSFFMQVIKAIHELHELHEIDLRKVQGIRVGFDRLEQLGAFMFVS